MSGRIKNKVEELERCMEELARIRPDTFDQYELDVKTKAACERYFEKVVENIVDIGFLVIKAENLPTPEEDKEAFSILDRASIIEPVLAKRLKEAKGMRNIIAHQYGEVDDELVFAAVKEELKHDAQAFILAIRKFMEKEK